MKGRRQCWFSSSRSDTAGCCCETKVEQPEIILEGEPDRARPSTPLVGNLVRNVAFGCRCRFKKTDRAELCRDRQTLRPRRMLAQIHVKHPRGS